MNTGQDQNAGKLPKYGIGLSSTGDEPGGLGKLPVTGTRREAGATNDDAGTHPAIAIATAAGGSGLQVRTVSRP